MSTALTRRRRSPLTVLGLALILAGLGCLGWVAYQYVGSNVVSRQAARTERSDLRRTWSAAPTPSPGDPGQPIPGRALALLRIPAFGQDYEVPVLEGAGLDVLARGVGHYPGTAGPGEVGNFALAGHRVTHGEPFRRLLELDRGDRVVVETREAVYTYVVDAAPRALTVSDLDTWVLDPVPGKPDQAPTEARLTLTTCQDLFHSPDRSIAFGHLLSAEPK